VWSTPTGSAGRSSRRRLTRWTSPPTSLRPRSKNSFLSGAATRSNACRRPGRSTPSSASGMTAPRVSHCVWPKAPRRWWFWNRKPRRARSWHRCLGSPSRNPSPWESLEPVTPCRGRSRHGCRERSPSVADPSGSDAFAEDLADFIAALRDAETRGRLFSGEGRGGVLAHHDDWMLKCFEEIDVLPGLKSRDSGLGRLTLPGASCFTALCGHVCLSYRRSTNV